MVSVGWLAGCTAERVATNPSGVTPAAIGSGEKTVAVLQMNLCNSGRASCYSQGRAVSMAAALIHRHRPEIVSLNEACRDDVLVLKQAMSTAFPAGSVASAFKSAEDRPSRAPVRCQNGQEFGNGILAVVPSSAHGVRSSSGVYPVQDLNDPEERAWVCLDLVTQFTACSTHTASTSATIALAQCQYVLNSTMPLMLRPDGSDPIILAGDLNLRTGGSPSPDSCLPRCYARTDDGGVQTVVVGPGLGIRSHSAIDTRGTTDHPALLVQVMLSRP